MYRDADAARLYRDERLDEVASILAAGLLRLRNRAALPQAGDQENPPESGRAGLEVPAETVLSGKAGGWRAEAGDHEERSDRIKPFKTLHVSTAAPVKLVCTWSLR